MLNAKSQGPSLKSDGPFVLATSHCRLPTTDYRLPTTHYPLILAERFAELDDVLVVFADISDLIRELFV